MSESSHEEMSGGQAAHVGQNIPPAKERAEVLVDQLGVQLGHWTNALGNGLQRFWARTREEGEDIWAEANDIRERNHVGTGASGHTEGGSSSESSSSTPQTGEAPSSATKAEQSH